MAEIFAVTVIQQRRDRLTLPFRPRPGRSTGRSVKWKEPYHTEKMALGALGGGTVSAGPVLPASVKPASGTVSGRI